MNHAGHPIGPEIERCTNCVTPRSWPGLTFDSQGVCGMCRAYQKRWGPFIRDPMVRAAALDRLDSALEVARRQRVGRYDALVPLSGGKDSLEVLRFLVEDRGLSVLCYTYDNGLFTEVALENMRIATRRLGCDHRIQRFQDQTALMAHFLRKTGNFCGACVIPYLVGAWRMARENRISLIMFGLSKRTDANLPDGMNPFHFRNVVADGFGMDRVRPIWGRAPIAGYMADALLGRVKVLNLPDFLPWDEAAIADRLCREWGVTLGEEHADCIGHQTADWLARRRYGFGFLPIKLSQWIREGRMNRQEALAIVARAETPIDEPPADLLEIVGRLGVSSQELMAGATCQYRRYYRGIGNRLAILHRNRFLGR